MPGRPANTALDGRAARFTALAIALAALVLMIWLGREDVPFVRAAILTATGQSEAEATSTGNPELDACLAKRVGDVDKLLAEGMIKESQYSAFKRRASSYCETQFPPAN
ncbi:hypothetical protein [Roseibium sp.]|uniref:hypothetical protein n=1 Tax=Roseibium sp. TaxID=1936156 RepID=UPI003A9784CF